MGFFLLFSVDEGGVVGGEEVGMHLCVVVRRGRVFLFWRAGGVDVVVVVWCVMRLESRMVR